MPRWRYHRSKLELSHLKVGLVSVNVGQPSIVGAYRGRPLRSGIHKRPVAVESLQLSTTNLEGDRQADLNVHGGPDKAVYAYPSEHIASWAAELGQELGPAAFGENLTVSGWLEDQVRIGDVWSWGEALLQVTQPREPCYKLATFRSRPDLPKKLVANGRTGWYLRVLRPGAVPVSGPIEVVERHDAALTVLRLHRAHILGEATSEELAAMAGLPELSAAWRAAIAEKLG